MTYKLTIIMGSGTSVEAGAPTFNGFNDKIKEIAESEYVVNTPNLKSSFENVIKLIEKYGNSNIEEIFSFTYLSQKLGEQNENLLNDLQVVIGKTIYDSLLSKDDDELFNRVHSHKKMALFLNSQNSPYPDFNIISFNWDVLMDKALMKNCLRDNIIPIVNYGFPRQINQNYSKPMLIKPHGSMNWGFCKKCSTAFYQHNKMKIYFDPTKASICPGCQKTKLSKIIIAPTYDKFSSANNLEEHSELKKIIRNIWLKMYELLSESDVILVLGYSFPKTDVEFLTFFKKAIYDKLSKRDERIHIVVVDWNPDPIVETLSKELNQPASDGLILKDKYGTKTIKKDRLRISSIKCKFSEFAENIDKIMSRISAECHPAPV